jgi:ankyrin repeat protein
MEASSDIIKAILDAGVHVDTKNAAGKTALHICAELGTIQVAQTLLENGGEFSRLFHRFKF